MSLFTCTCTNFKFYKKTCVFDLIVIDNEYLMDKSNLYILSFPENYGSVFNNKAFRST